jgi:hypothetical protein
MASGGIMVGGDPAAPHSSALHPFEDNPAAIWGDVEVANVKVRSEFGQLPLGARLEVDEPEILVLNLSSQEQECSSSRQEGQVSSAASESQHGQWMHCRLGDNSLHRKCGADVRSRVDIEAAVGRPRGMKGGSGKADFSAALNMEFSDGWVLSQPAKNFDPTLRNAHTHHITLVDADVTQIPNGFQVTGTATFTLNGGPAPTIVAHHLW